MTDQNLTELEKFKSRVKSFEDYFRDPLWPHPAYKEVVKQNTDTIVYRVFDNEHGHVGEITIKAGDGENGWPRISCDPVVKKGYPQRFMIDVTFGFVGFLKLINKSAELSRSYPHPLPEVDQTGTNLHPLPEVDQTGTNLPFPEDFEDKTGYDRYLIEMWNKGYTGPDIAENIRGVEKDRINNRRTELRNRWGKELVVRQS